MLNDYPNVSDRVVFFFRKKKVFNIRKSKRLDPYSFVGKVQISIHADERDGRLPRSLRCGSSSKIFRTWEVGPVISRT